MPARLTAVGMTTDAGVFSGGQPVNSAARVQTRAAAARALEDRIVAAWDPAWDAHWGDPRRFRAVLVTVAEMVDYGDTGTQSERLLFKTCLRVAQMLMTRAEAMV